MKDQSFFKSVIRIAIPVAWQSMLQSSFSMIDQVMVGQLGSTEIAAVGIAGKFAFLYSVVIGAVTAIAGIQISQYIGQKNEKLSDRSLCVNLLLSCTIGSLFTLVSLLFPVGIMRLYSEDPDTVSIAAEYLQIIAGTYLPMGVASTLSVMLRCYDHARAPLVATTMSAVINTTLNFVLIFGHFGFPAMGVRGAATASAISGWINMLIIIWFMVRLIRNRKDRFAWSVKMNAVERKQYLFMLIPVVVNEFLWGLGQNVFTSIYGHIGTQEAAAVALISPV